MFHTIGQRQGLGIGGQRTRSGEPWYVAAKDASRNALIVVQGHDHPLLQSRRFATGTVRWLAVPPADEFECAVQVRHRQAAEPAHIRWSVEGAHVTLATPMRAVAPGQYAAFYRDEECLGGAAILESLPAPAAWPQAAARLRSVGA